MFPCRLFVAASAFDMAKVKLFVPSVQFVRHGTDQWWDVPSSSLSALHLILAAPGVQWGPEQAPPSRSQESRMPKNGTSKVVVGLAASFTGLAGAIIFLLVTKTVSAQLGILMLVASVGLHLGFGILIAVYRLVSRLE
jgi:hypothetical protein